MVLKLALEDLEKYNNKCPKKDKLNPKHLHQDLIHQVFKEITFKAKIHSKGE